MKRFFIYIVIFAAAAQAMVTSAWAGAAYPETTQAPGYDGYLVKFTDGVGVPCKYREALESVAPELFSLDSAQLIKPLLDSGAVEYIEPNYIAQLCADDAAQTGTETSADKGWAYDAVRADFAEKQGLDGTGVRIAVIDSGINAENADLKSAHIEAGWNYKTGTADVADDIGHGTKVAQMIVGADNGLGTTGIARGAAIVPLKCFASGQNTSVEELVSAINAAVDDYKCTVINMSWCIPGSSQTLSDAIDHAVSKGAVCVAAVGNTNNIPQGTVTYPAAYDNVIGVGSVDAEKLVASTSIQSSAVDVCAPGSGLTFVDTGTGANEAKTSGGTSFASPCVAAAAALIKQANPQLTNGDVTALFEGRAEDLGDSGRDDKYGYGFVGLDKVLADSWFHKSVNTDGTLSVRGFRIGGASLQSGETQTFAVMYASTGRMEAVQAVTQSAGTSGMNIDFSSATDGAEVKLFYLDSSYAPVQLADIAS